MSKDVKTDIKEDLKPEEGAVYRVVISATADRSLVGVMKPGCDPVMATVEGGWEAAMKEMPRLMDEAAGKWRQAPRNPKYDRPTPPAATQPAPRPATPARTTSGKKKGQEQVEEYKLL